VAAVAVKGLWRVPQRSVRSKGYVELHMSRLTTDEIKATQVLCDAALGPWQRCCANLLEEVVARRAADLDPDELVGLQHAVASMSARNTTEKLSSAAWRGLAKLKGIKP
jgi:hypothetical protein